MPIDDLKRLALREAHLNACWHLGDMSCRHLRESTCDLDSDAIYLLPGGDWLVGVIWRKSGSSMGLRSLNTSSSPIVVQIPIPEAKGLHLLEYYLAFSDQRKPLLVLSIGENRDRVARIFHTIIVYAIHTSPPSFERLVHIHVGSRHKIWAPSIGGNLLAYLTKLRDGDSDDPWTLHIRTIDATSRPVRQVVVGVLQVQAGYRGPGIVVLSEERLLIVDDISIRWAHISGIKTDPSNALTDSPIASVHMDQIYTFGPAEKLTSAINHTLWSEGRNRGHNLPLLFRSLSTSDGPNSKITPIVHILDHFSPDSLPRHSIVTLPERGRYCALGIGLLRSISTDDWGPLQEQGDDTIPLMGFYSGRRACEQWAADDFKTGRLVVLGAAQMYLRAFDEVSGRICLADGDRLLVIDVEPPGHHWDQDRRDVGL